MKTLLRSGFVLLALSTTGLFAQSVTAPAAPHRHHRTVKIVKVVKKTKRVAPKRHRKHKRKPAAH